MSQNVTDLTLNPSHFHFLNFYNPFINFILRLSSSSVLYLRNHDEAVIENVNMNPGKVKKNRILTTKNFRAALHLNWVENYLSFSYSFLHFSTFFSEAEKKFTAENVAFKVEKKERKKLKAADPAFAAIYIFFLLS